MRKKISNSKHHKTIHVLDIPDDYGFMDAELQALVLAKVAAVLGIEEEQQWAILD